MTDGELGKYRAARKTVEKERATRIFLIHLAAYLIGNVALVLWNVGTYYLRDDKVWWFYIPLLFWGVGLVIHYLLAVALFDNWWDRDERMITERIER